MVNLASLRARFFARIWHGAQRSYSQAGEDMIARFALNAMGILTPFYIDVGAYHPYHFSNTAHFYDASSHGINIEPNPALFEEFKRQRRRDINLNVAVGPEPGELDFYIMSPPTMSTFSRQKAERLVADHGFRISEIRKIRIQTLADILARHATGRYPEFMSIDIEGAEEEVLRRIDFRDWSPLVICCETISFSTTGKGEKNLGLIEYLKSQGYMIYADTWVNTIFVLESAWKKE